MSVTWIQSVDWNLLQFGTSIIVAFVWDVIQTSYQVLERPESWKKIHLV